MYGLRENSVNEKHELCGVIVGHGHVYVCVLERERETDRERQGERVHGVCYIMLNQFL